jgi:hypothetical protein
VTLQGAIRYSIHLNQSREHGSKVKFSWVDLISAEAIMIVHILALNSADDVTKPLLEARDTIDAMAPIVEAIKELSMSCKGYCVPFTYAYVKLNETIHTKESL